MERGAAPGSEVSAAGFDLDAIETRDGTISVSGRWHGVRGRRFMRPSLSVAGEGERVLADLEHKPWSAEGGESWVAVFPWDRPLDGIDELELEVAPDLTVRLPVGDGAGAAKTSPSRRTNAAEARIGEAVRDRDAARADRDAARAERDRAIDERERALSQLHEAVQLRKQAENSRAAMVDERDAAQRARERMREEQERMRGERDAAVQEAERLTQELHLAQVRAEADTEALRTQLALAREELVAAREDLATARRDLAAAENEMLAAHSDPHPAPTRPAVAAAPVELLSTPPLPPVSMVPPRPRRTLDWDGNPCARWVAAGAVLVVALILLLILVLR